MIGGALFSVSIAKPAAVLYRLMNASRSAAGMTSSMSSNTPPQRVEQIEKAKRSGPTIPQDHRRDLGAQSRIVRLQRGCGHAMLEDGGAQHPRVHDRLTGPVRTRWIHHVGRIAEQRNPAVHPRGHGIAIDHWILEDGVGAAEHRWNVEPVVVPAVEMMDERFDVHAPVPVAGGPPP
jgi:hypothetical protein